jgi:hypothetical protein
MIKYAKSRTKGSTHPKKNFNQTPNPLFHHKYSILKHSFHLLSDMPPPCLAWVLFFLCFALLINFFASKIPFWQQYYKPGTQGPGRGFLSFETALESILATTPPVLPF